MTPKVAFQPICLSTREGGEEACLVLVDNALSAILVRLADGDVGSEEAGWYLEAGFPPYEVEGLVFACLTAAETWIREQVSRGSVR